MMKPGHEQLRPTGPAIPQAKRLSSPGAALRAPQSRRSLSELPVDERSPTVLVVDDNQENCDLYRECLTRLGFRVVDASDGATAIQRALADEPDVIVMDLAMPVMDGYTATRLLKSDQKTRAIPIVVLTAAGMDQHGRAEAAGCDVFLVKPCALDDLEGVLRSCVQLRRDDRSSSPALTR